MAQGHQPLVLGLDIGSVSLSIVQLDQDGNILQRFHKSHKGNLRSSLSEASKVFDLSRVKSFACTSSSAALNKKLVRNYNSQVAIITAHGSSAKKLFQSCI